MKSFLILNKTKTSGTIAIAVTIQGKRIKTSTGIQCHPSKFKDGQPIRTQTLIRERIYAIQSKVDEYLLTTDEVTPMGIKQIVKSATGQQKNNTTNLKGLINSYLAIKKNEVKPITMQKIDAHLEHFQAFKPNKELKDIDSLLWEQYTTSLKKEGLLNQSINVYIKNIRTFLNWLIKHSYAPPTIKNGLNHLPTDESHIIAINPKELEQLHDPIDKDGNKIELPHRLERVKDLFLFSCYTGLRFSDLKQVNEDLIYNGIMTVKQHKTGGIIQIPILDEVTTILQKYNYQLPTISNQKLNSYLKELFKLLGLKRKVHHRKGIKQLDEVISFHVSRKSFITIALTKGVPAKMVQSISGHKKDAIFNQYIAFSNSALQSEMQKMSRGKVVQMQKVI